MRFLVVFVGVWLVGGDGGLMLFWLVSGRGPGGFVVGGFLG